MHKKSKYNNFLEEPRGINPNIFKKDRRNNGNFRLDETKIKISEDSLDSKKIIRRKKSILKRIFLILISILMILAIILYFWGDSLVSKITGGKSGLIDAATSIINNKPIRLSEDENKITNFLVFGTSGYDMSGSGHDGANLTDSIMLVSLRQDTGEVYLLNLPRDLKVSEGCMIGKLNEVFDCNSRKGNKQEKEENGRKALGKVIEKITGQKIHYYAHINWGAMVGLVDLIGGIEVVLDENINDRNTNIYIRKGIKTRLNGDKTLALARARYGSVGGDYSRGNSQQKIIIAIAEKVKARGFNFTELFEMMNKLGDNLRVSLNVSEIKSLFKIGEKSDITKIKNLKLKDVEKGIGLVTGKKDSRNGLWYEVPVAGDYSEIRKYIQENLKPEKTEETNLPAEK